MLARAVVLRAGFVHNMLHARALAIGALEVANFLIDRCIGRRGVHLTVAFLTLGLLVSPLPSLRGLSPLPPVLLPLPLPLPPFSPFPRPAPPPPPPSVTAPTVGSQRLP